MISCQLQGGLGNQLFQIATTMAYAMRYRHPFVFPRVKTLCRKRSTYWDSFLSDLSPYLLDPSQIYMNITNIGTNFGTHFGTKIREQGFAYNALPLPITNSHSILLSGYFQSPLYFDDYKEPIMELWGIRRQQQELLNQTKQTLKQDEITISMHFRQGDYALYPQVHPILTIDYYIQSLNHIQQHIINGIPVKELEITNAVNVLYFCENQDSLSVEIMISELRDLFPLFRFERADPSLTDWQQLLLMSLCNHHIIANSTFSWWGAYLHGAYLHQDKTNETNETNETKETNKEKEKEETHIVCYPRQWFAPVSPLSQQTDTLFPNSWTAIVHSL